MSEIIDFINAVKITWISEVLEILKIKFTYRNGSKVVREQSRATPPFCLTLTLSVNEILNNETLIDFNCILVLVDVIFSLENYSN